MMGKGRRQPRRALPLGGSPRLVMAGSVLIMGSVGIVSAVSLDALSLGSHDAPPSAMSGPGERVGPQPVGPVAPPPPAAVPAPTGPSAAPDPTGGLPGPGSVSAPAPEGAPATAAPRRTSAQADRRVGRFTGPGAQPATRSPASRSSGARAQSVDRSVNRSDGHDGDDDGDESRYDRDTRRINQACKIAAKVFDGPWDAEDCVEYVGRHRASN